MPSIENNARIRLNNILYLTDFSGPSEAALPYAITLARAYGAKVIAFHALAPVLYLYSTPELTDAAIQAQEESAQMEMQRVESQLVGVPNETFIERGIAVLPTVENALQEYKIDLVVLGTHGRTGAQKLLMGSVAEEIFRRLNVPVLTIGPGVYADTHRGAQFRRILFSTDFSEESLTAAPYAFSIAQENQAHLYLLHVVPHGVQEKAQNKNTLSAAEVLHRLKEIVPREVAFWCDPEPVVKYGAPAEEILTTANDRGAELIVLGVRSAAGRLGAATHLEWTTAHRVVAHARCPVLTVRG